MARAIRFHQAGGPEVLRLEPVEVGAPGPGQVRLRHRAIGLNYADTYFRNGTYPVPLPSGIGVEAAGIVFCQTFLDRSWLWSAPEAVVFGAIGWRSPAPVGVTG